MKTPRHIIPEWYFLPFYAILKLVPYKTLGILLMIGTLLFPIALPFLNISFKRYSLPNKKNMQQLLQGLTKEIKIYFKRKITVGNLKYPLNGVIWSWSLLNLN